MPLPDSLLDKPLNAHRCRPAGETVLAALRDWRGTPGAASWWWLVIDHGQGRFTATRFDSLRQMLARPALGVTMATRLADLPAHAEPLPGVVTPPTVEQDAATPAQARQLQAASPGGMLVVLRDGAFRGVLASAERTFAFTDRPLLDMIEQYEQVGGSSGDGEGANASPEPSA